MNKIICLLAVAFAVAACASTRPAVAVGADQDAHRCKASAGYTFSPLRQSCIRIWEEGFALKEAQNPDAPLAAFIVPSPDGTEAEAFLPGKTEPVRLSRSSRDLLQWQGGRGWKLVSRAGAHGGVTWDLFERGTLRYTSRPAQAN